MRSQLKRLLYHTDTLFGNSLADNPITDIGIDVPNHNGTEHDVSDDDRTVATQLRLEAMQPKGLAEQPVGNISTARVGATPKREKIIKDKDFPDIFDVLHQ